MRRGESVEYSEWETWVEDNDAIVLDIRQPFEWELGTLPDSVLIPMTDLLSRIDELPKDRSILCVCRSGSRSGRVAAYLRSVGFARAANMEGGLKALGMQD
jgi:rhodanese-related sulfurtransferase